MNCDIHEANVSAWLDDQLERSEQIELLDHLVRCESCRGFYAEARALDGLVAAVRTPADADAPPPAVWDRIQDATGARPAASRSIGLPNWAMRIAAAIVLAIGVGVVYWSGDLGSAPRPAQAEVLIGGEAGSMTDERFIELTREVLQAEPRYHGAMLQIMEQVVSDTSIIEASIEEGIPQPEDGEPIESAETPGLPA